MDVLTVQIDGKVGSTDTAVLDRATALGRVVVTADEDFKIEAARRQRLLVAFAGVVFLDLNRLTIGQCLHDLEIIAQAGESDDLVNRIEYLPL